VSFHSRSFYTIFRFPKHTSNSLVLRLAKNEEGPYGELLPLFTQDDLEAFVTSSASNNETPFVGVIAPSLFTRINVESLLPPINSKPSKPFVQGFLVLHPVSFQNVVNISKPEQWSPELKNPNREYGLYPNSTVVWNPNVCNCKTTLLQKGCLWMQLLGRRNDLHESARACLLADKR